ncbi:MAG: hypothetical protein MUP58_02280 [Candidatus Nanohaloarchaeota archaeon QJJ-9]|nr:hypothetical protein [Candidatus Nanohaloarchaeota archaeon QJJ-9]
MKDNNYERCMHGCYPLSEVDGKTINDLREVARTEGPEEAEKKLDKWCDNEPYVGADGDDAHQREFKVSANGQGPPKEFYIVVLDQIENKFNYNLHKVSEWLHTNPGSQLHQEMEKRRQEAEQQVKSVLANMNERYQEKQNLLHDKRKLESKKEHFRKAIYECENGHETTKLLTDEKAEDSINCPDCREDSELREKENAMEEALKADFVDQVDQHTGQHSILQMQQNNIFPSLTADFYSMESLDDLKDGHLSDLPEQEKAMLRKKYKLYEKWKEKFSKGLERKLKDVNTRLQSIERGIKETENWLKPHVKTIKQMEGDIDAEIGAGMTEPNFLQGASSSLRKVKVIAERGVGPSVTNEDEEKKDGYKDVIVMDVTQAGLGGMENPNAPSQGPAVIDISFKEYLVCKHVYDEVFRPQIKRKQNEVKEVIQEYLGSSYEEEIVDWTEKEYTEYRKPISKQIKHNFLKWAGIGDEFYVGDPEDLRQKMLGPGFARPMYLEIEFEFGLNVMK